MNTLRCFVAADLPEGVVATLGHLQQRLRENRVRARWVRSESMHLTLKFVGEVEPTVFEQLRAVLGEPLGVDAPLELQPRGVGTFPPGPRPRVVWAGLAGDLPALAAAAREVEERLAPLGVPRERRLFRPHLTLGRLGGGDVRRHLAAALEREEEFAGPVFAVQHLILYESHLRPEGATYTPHLRIPLR